MSDWKKTKQIGLGCHDTAPLIGGIFENLVHSDSLLFGETDCNTRATRPLVGYELKLSITTMASRVWSVPNLGLFINQLSPHHSRRSQLKTVFLHLDLLRKLLNLN